MSSIVLNGKLYDAATGELVHAPKHQPTPKPAIKRSTGLVIDGIHHTSKAPKAPHKAKATKPVVKAPPASPRVEAAAHPHKPQKAATLMRHAVHKPAPVQHDKPAASLHDAKAAERLERARAVERSKQIHHFPKHHTHHAAHHTTRPVTKKHAPVAVEAAPVEHHTKPTPTAPQHESTPVSASEQLYANALKHATAHEATQHVAKKPRRRMNKSLTARQRTVRFALSATAVIALLGFFAYQNVPNVSVRFAAARAGFNAQLPGYTPSGFKQDSVVTYAPGKVTVSFHSNSDTRAFQLSQQVSNWNSASLADNYLAANDKQYQSFQANGKTIYVYDGNSATWVNGGVWYQIQGKDSNLTNEQLVKIANSI